VDHSWFTRSTSEKRPVTGDIIIIITISENGERGLIKYGGIRIFGGWKLESHDLKKIKKFLESSFNPKIEK
jgi:hypothetical protein